ncbi:MAG: hypothetical protein ACK4SX_11930 [Alcanivoracaceae bacterium]
MKKYCALVAAMAAATVSPLVMADSASIDAQRIGLFGGVANMNSNEEGSDYPNTFEGNAVANIPVGQSYSVQLGADVAIYGEQDRGDDYGPQSRVTFTTHFSRRNAETGLVGGFVGLGRGVGYGWPEYTDLGKLAGLEAQRYMGNVTLYGQAYYSDFVLYDSGSTRQQVRGFLGSAAARYFPAEDTMLELGIGLGSSRHYNESDRGDFSSASFKAKQRVSKANPVYASLTLRTAKIDNTTRDSIGYESSVLVGVEVLFGATSLKDNDRRGATLDTPILATQAAAWNEELY